MFAAGVRAVSSSSSTAEQPLQSVSPASRNIQQDESVSIKANGQAASIRPAVSADIDAAKLSASAMAAAKAKSAAADDEQRKQDAEALDRNGLKLFATAGHGVTSFVADEEDDSSIHEQQTVSTTPYDELD